MSDDREFLREVYKSVAWTWVIAMTWALVLQKLWVALSITFGMILGTAVLASYELVVRRAFTSGASKPKRILLKFGLLKYPVLAVVLYLLVRWNQINVLALCSGVALVHFAIVAKALGYIIAEQLASRDPMFPVRRSK